MILYIDDKARQLNSLDRLTLNPKFQTQVLTILHQNLGLESHNPLCYSVSVITTFSLCHIGIHPSTEAEILPDLAITCHLCSTVKCIFSSDQCENYAVS